MDGREEEDRLAKLKGEENNPMKNLGNRTIDSKQAMDVWDALQDIPTQYMKWMSRALGGSACTDKFIGDRRRRDSAKRKNQGSNGR